MYVEQQLPPICSELNSIRDSQISVIVEYVAGKITTSLMRLISLYRPDCECHGPLIPGRSELTVTTSLSIDRRNKGDTLQIASTRQGIGRSGDG